MKDLLVYIVQQLVNNPDSVSVDESRDGSEVNLLLTVDPADMGIVIGKGGQTIKAIRRVLAIRAMSDNVRVNLQIKEPEGSKFEKKENEEEESQESEKIQESETVTE